MKTEEKGSHYFLAVCILLAVSACADQHKPKEVVKPLYCAPTGAVSQPVVVSPQCEEPPPPPPPSCNLNSRCVYVAAHTTAFCWSRDERLRSTVETTPVPESSATSLIKEEACCGPDAKKVTIAPAVAGGWVDANCGWHNFTDVPVDDPDDPNDDDCVAPGVIYPN